MTDTLTMAARFGLSRCPAAAPARLARTPGPLAGAGGGNYALQAGSPAKNIAQAVLRFDAAGATRTATTSAGAYQ